MNKYSFKMISISSCPVCHSSEIKEWNEIIDYSVSGEKFKIFLCSDCTVKFTQNIPSKNEIGIYYQSDKYISHSDSRSGLVNQLYHIVRSFTMKKKVALVKNTSGKNSGRLFDLGSGTGTFLNAMKNAGWDVFGMEPDIQARNISIAKGIHVDDPENLTTLSPSTFDAITLWHVMEHIHDLHQSLDSIRKSIKDDGVLIVAVPNYLSYDAQFYNEYWAAYDVPRHLYHFTPEALKKLMMQHDFKLSEIKPMWFDSFYVSMLSEKYKNGSLLKAIIIGMISNLIALLNKKRCSSLIYIFKPYSKI